MIYNKKIISIQALRGFAALLVCIMHCVTSKYGTNVVPYTVTVKIGRFFASIGGYGVDLFFTISGFIITWLITKNNNNNSIKDAFSFLIKRCFRIYPLYWITFIVLYCLLAKAYYITVSNDINHSINVGRFFLLMGKYGANLFFVGVIAFILLWTFFRNKIHDVIQKGFSFLNRIISKFYLLFWNGVLLLILFTMLIGYKIGGLVMVDHIQAILLLTRNIPFLLPAWTLAFEMYFYLGAFLILCLFPVRYFIRCLVIWGSFHLIILALYFQHKCAITGFVFTNVQILEFFMGGLIIPLLQISHKTISDKYITIVLGIVLFIIGCVITYIRFPERNLENWEVLFFHGFSAFFIIYGLTGIESLRTIFVPKFLEKIGDISYSIYLWHFPMMAVSTILRLKFSFYALLPALVQAAFEVFMTILISLWSYKAIEMPFIHLSRKIGKSVSTVQSH